MTDKKVGRKFIPPPPMPPLILMKHLSKIERLPIYQPNRNIYSNITLSLNNLVNVERHINDMDFERKKEYDKKSEMCKDFKENEEEKTPGLFGNILNNLNPLNNLTQKRKKNKPSNKEKEDNEDNEDDKHKLPKNSIILNNIEISDEIGNISKYKNNILTWHQ